MTLLSPSIYIGQFISTIVAVTVRLRHHCFVANISSHILWGDSDDIVAATQHSLLLIYSFYCRVCCRRHLSFFECLLPQAICRHQRKQSTFMASCVSEAKANALSWDKFHIIYARWFIVWSRSHLFVPSSSLITSNTPRARNIICMPLATWALKKGMRQ